MGSRAGPRLLRLVPSAGQLVAGQSLAPEPSEADRHRYAPNTAPSTVLWPSIHLTRIFGVILFVVVCNFPC